MIVIRMVKQAVKKGHCIEENEIGPSSHLLRKSQTEK